MKADDGAESYVGVKAFVGAGAYVRRNAFVNAGAHVEVKAFVYAESYAGVKAFVGAGAEFYRDTLSVEHSLSAVARLSNHLGLVDRASAKEVSLFAIFAAFLRAPSAYLAVFRGIFQPRYNPILD